ncbi:MAG TPA: hypothetical protein PKK43_04665 [Spirochaetota bacterium]|nr:hypothetical protein [Spirochaetota bacterium]
MEKALILKSVSVFIFVWGIAVVFLWFRPKIEIFWKVVATLLFLFYIWFFSEEISKGFLSIRADWYPAMITFFKELLVILFANLFFLWPVILIVIFYKSDDIGAEKLLKFMCVFTVFIWIVLVAYAFYDKKIDTYLYEKLKTFVPFARP